MKTMERPILQLESLNSGLHFTSSKRTSLNLKVMKNYFSAVDFYILESSHTKILMRAKLPQFHTVPKFYLTLMPIRYLNTLVKLESGGNS